MEPEKELITYFVAYAAQGAGGSAVGNATFDTPEPIRNFQDIQRLEADIAKHQGYELVKFTFIQRLPV